MIILAPLPPLASSVDGTRSCSGSGVDIWIPIDQQRRTTKENDRTIFRWISQLQATAKAKATTGKSKDA